VEFTDGGMTMRTVCKVVGLKHWEAEREMRVAFKQRLEQEGIVISYPHLVVVSDDKE
jgi:small-conductance mechanosensitive channel